MVLLFELYGTEG